MVGHQVAVCVEKRKKMQFFWFQKFNFDCFLHYLMICSPTTENIISFVCPLWTETSLMISGTKIFSPLFSLALQIMTFSQFFWKSDLLGHLSSTQILIMLKVFEENLKYL